MSRSDFKFGVGMSLLFLLFIGFIVFFAGWMVILKAVLLVAAGFVLGAAVVALWYSVDSLLDWLYDKFVSKH